jgi:galactonate dehydratase
MTAPHRRDHDYPAFTSDAREGRMKITGVEPFIVGNPWKNWVFVRVETDAGIEGLGEATIGFNAKPMEAIVREISHLCMGRDPRDVNALWDHLFKSLYLPEGNVQRSAIASIELACWDILGKSLGVPVYKLLGGACRDRLRAYANGWYQGPRDPDFFGERAKLVVSRGYTALKLDPFGSAYRTLSHREEELSMRLLRAVRDAVGDDVDILIDAHNRFTVSTAIRVSRRLEEFHPTLFGAPTLSSNLEGLIAVAKVSPIPVTAGSRVSTAREASILLSQSVIDIISPDLLDLGGVWPTREVCAIASAHNAMVALHNARGPLCTTANCHLALTLRNFWLQESFDEFNESWTRELFRGTPEVRDGYVYVSDAPGLGLQLNEQVAREHPYGQTNFMRLFEEGWETRRPPVT